MGKGLTPRQGRFVVEYLVDLNTTRAAERAGYSRHTAEKGAWKLLKNALVADEIARAIAAREARTAVTADVVLARLWAIATADAGELVQLRYVNCRYCWGVGFEYQWSRVEWAAAVADAKSAGRDAPVAGGGLGFVLWRDPNAGCPECGGVGVAEVFVADTRSLSASAKLLYVGARRGKDGLEIKLQDQFKALELVARHVGLGRDAVMMRQAELDAELKRLEIARRSLEVGAGGEVGMLPAYTMLSPDEEVPEGVVV